MRIVVFARLSRRLVISSSAGSLVLVVICFVVGRVWGYQSREFPKLHQGSSMPKVVPLRPQTSFECAVTLVGEIERRRTLEQCDRLQRHPELITPHFCRNPLILGGPFRVEVRNRSGRALSIYSSGHPYFWVGTRIRNAAGQPVVWDEPTLHSLKRFGTVLPGTPVTTLEPGKVVSEGFSILGYGDLVDRVKPGRYTVRAICSYFRAPDGADCRVESEPIVVTITERDIREWRDFLEAEQDEEGVEEIRTEPR